MRARLEILQGLEGQDKSAVSIARTLGSDPKALLYLMSSGNIDTALAAASSSGDTKGFETLASEMRQIDPCTSFLCAQARLLQTVEDSRKV